MKNITEIVQSKIFILLLGILLALSSCRKRENPLTWNADYSAPLAYGSLSITDLVPDSLVVVNGDSSVILAYEGELLNLEVEEFLSLPDTIIKDTFQVLFPSPVDLTPGQVFINISEEQNLTLSGGVELTHVKILSGEVNYELESTVQGIVEYTYEIPSATDWTGNIFTKTITVPSAPSGGTTIKTGTFSLDGYYLDLQGQSGNETNKFRTTINCKISTGNSSDITVSSTDQITIANEFKDIVIEEAEGYFGQHTLSTGLDYASFESFSKWVSGNIDIDDLDVDLVLSNGIGVDAFIQLNQLVSNGVNTSVSLVHSMFGDLISLPRATRYYDSIVPTSYSAHLDPSNSNVDEFLEALPQQIGYDLDVEINPLGNVSGYNDFYNMNAPIGLFLKASMPLIFIAEELTLEDTLTMSIDETSGLNEITLTVEVENGFPLSADIEIGVLDVNDNIISRIFAPTMIDAGELNINGKVIQSSNSIHEVVIDAVDLKRIQSHGKLILTVVFDSPGTDHVTIYEHYTLDYKIKADVNVSLSIGND